MATRRRKRRAPGRTVKLKPADPFELIRWLARSQSDPRKAVAELVQNSLDAGARRVVIQRLRVKREVTLIIRDDGDGVLPGREREEALMHIATHIGHSHKLGLDVAARRERVVAGQYGVGLLGFWSIGGRLELRSRVTGSALFALQMEEDSPKAHVTQLPLRTDGEDTFTEVVVGPLHSIAQKALTGRKLSEYLASELRGQLLASATTVEVFDRIARGTAQKHFVVMPRRFSGERLDIDSEIAVEGFEPMRVELYVAQGADENAIQLHCAGTIVADDLTTVGALGISGPPWRGRDVSGVIDFASFSVPPGTRRGVAPDLAAQAFVAALRQALEPRVDAELDKLDEQRRAAADRNVVKDLRRALRGLHSRLPHYDLPQVGVPGSRSRVGEGPPGEAVSNEGGAASEPMALAPPGPLASVAIVPAKARIAPGAERRVTAMAHDGDGRRLHDVGFEWRMPDGARVGLSLRGGGARPALITSPDARLGALVPLMVVATQGEITASAIGSVLVADAVDGKALATGIPQPMLLSDPDRPWRSRMVGERWEVNEAHADYVGLRDNAKGRTRYLLMLLAREIVLRTTGRFDAADIIDSHVEVMAHAERNLRGR